MFIGSKESAIFDSWRQMIRCYRLSGSNGIILAVGTSGLEVE